MQSPTFNAAFIVTPPPPVTFTEPQDLTVDACDFADQAALNAAFNTWLTVVFTQAAVAGGCDPQVANDAASVTVPDLCAGGTATVTWSVTDLCETPSFNAVFTVTPHIPIIITCAPAQSLSACSSQAAVQAAYDAWSAGFSFTGGCSTASSNISSFPTLPADASSLGANLSFSYTITDVCSTESCTSTFIVAPVIPILITCAPAQTLPACSTDAAVQAAYSAWVGGFSFAGGSSASDNISEIPTLPAGASCTGVNLSFNYIITDACGSQTCPSAFIVEPSTPIVLTCAPAQSLPSCASQAAVQAAYDVWSAGFSFTGGCSTATSNISDIPALPADASCSGATLTFTYTVTDACALQTCTSAFTVASNTPPVISCPPSPQVRTLEPNERRYRTVGNEFDYISLSDDCGTPVISNNLNNRNTLDGYDFQSGATSVTWTATDECGNTAECSFIVIIDSPNIELVKTGSYVDSNNDGINNTGDRINYTFSVTNSGTVALTNVIITDPLITVIGGPISSLAPGVTDNTTFTGTYIITQPDIDVGRFTNTATATGRFRGRDYTSTDDYTLTLIQRPSVSITKVVDILTISQPGTLSYTVTIVNNGNINLSNIFVTDILPDGSNGTLTGPTGDGGAAGVLDVNETWTYSITYSVSQNDINAGDNLVNTATVDTDQTEPLSDNATTTINRTSSLTINKVVDLATISQPGVLTYSITIVNTGNTSLSNIVVTDILPDRSNGTLTGPTGDGGVAGVLGVNETWTYSITYSVSQNDINAGDTCQHRYSRY